MFLGMTLMGWFYSAVLPISLGITGWLWQYWHERQPIPGAITPPPDQKEGNTVRTGRLYDPAIMRMMDATLMIGIVVGAALMGAAVALPLSCNDGEHVGDRSLL
ncbi:hypothetical protein ACFQX4_23560 [Roseomonas sp. GCM10028921]